MNRIRTIFIGIVITSLYVGCDESDDFEPTTNLDDSG
jgi:hypothetical protein